jgi:cobyrinic acid a,c-diamide synthase
LASKTPRIVIAGTGGDSGKTLVTLSILCALRRRGLSPVAFKKGPDFIDAAWLGWAAGRPATNLDTFLMGTGEVEASFAWGAGAGDMSLVEGNRGLIDGMDAGGTHSTAVLAGTLGAPVVLVVPITKVTATAAAWVEGCRRLAPQADVRAVILNRVAGERHGRVAAEAVESLGVRVVGRVPRLRGPEPLPDRHLGLVTPEEHGRLEGMRDRLAGIAEDHVDLDAILELARSAPDLAEPPAPPAAEPEAVRVGVLRDSAFTFYYPDNLEALERAGARIVEVSALSDASLPEVDALVIGGGFPETHARRLARNEALRADVQRAAGAGLPVYAECGGLMYLARALHWKDGSYPMAGVLPFDVVMHDRPRGHGYASATVDRPNPFFEEGTELRGHEFHYSSPADVPPGVDTAYRVERGTGLGDGRDAASCKNVLAAYIHLHARGCPEWAPGVVRAALRYRKEESGPSGPRG